jgi:hypothetical protein
MRKPRRNGAFRKDGTSVKLTIEIRFADGQTVVITVEPPP